MIKFYYKTHKSAQDKKVFFLFLKPEPEPEFQPESFTNWLIFIHANLGIFKYF